MAKDMTPRWDNIHGLTDTDFMVDVLLANTMQDGIADLKKQRDEVLERIDGYLAKVSQDKVLIDVGEGDTTVTRVPPGEQKTLNKAKLIQLGVTQQQIDAATTKTPKKGYLLISRPKGDAEA